MENEVKNKSSKNLVAVLSFFVLEVLAFVGFTFTNSYFVYALFGMVIMMVIGMATYDEWRKKGSTSFLIFIIPLVIFAIISAFSNFSRSIYSVANNLVTIIGLLSFVLTGYLTKFIKGFQIKYALLAIYGGIFLVLFISFIYSMIYYCPFYTILFPNKYFYYDGSRYLVTNSIEFLMGFRFEEVPLTYFSTFASLLFTSIVGLRFISPKKDTRLFIIYAVFGFFGFLCLLFTINRYNVATDALLIVMILFIMFFPKKGKMFSAAKIAGYCVLGLASLFFVVALFNAQNNPATNWLSSLISNNSLLNKVFNDNHWSQSYKSALAGCFEPRFLFGHPAVAGSTFDGLIGYSAAPGSYYITKFADSWFFDAFYTSGIFGVAAITAFFVFSFKSMVRYYKTTSDDCASKNLVVSFIVGFVLYATFALPFIGETHVALFTTLIRNPLFLIVLFLIGYTYTSKKEIIEIPNDCPLKKGEEVNI